MNNWRIKPEPIRHSQLTDTVETDVVVVGLGYSGAAAVRAAVEAGCSVIGLEMRLRNRFMTMGRDIGHINSEFLKSRGVPTVDPIDLFTEMMRRAGNRANPALVMQFAQNCGTAFDWFTDMYGIEGLSDVKVAFWPCGAEKFKAHTGDDYSGYHFWNGTAQFPDPRGWPGSPTLPALVMANLKKAEQLGATLKFGETAIQPQIAGNRVVGVIAQGTDNKYHQYLAKKGIILAAGGFSGNKEMMEDLVTDVGDMLRQDQVRSKTFGPQGLGHQIGVWAGGRLEPRPLPTMGGNYPTICGFTTFGILWLDRNGKRFCNETFGGPELASLPAAQMPQGTFYSLFDEHILEDLAWAVPAHGGFDQLNPASTEVLSQIISNAIDHPCGHPDSMKPMQKAFPYGYVADNIYSGESPEKLVHNAGLTGSLAEHIIQSIHHYNALCTQGRDEDFGKDAKLLRPLSSRLFLQMTSLNGTFGNVLTTVGGFVTDENQNVLGQDYEPIPGLYATGNCCGRRFGSIYTTPIAGISIGMAITLGREVGKRICQPKI